MTALSRLFAVVAAMAVCVGGCDSGSAATDPANDQLVMAEPQGPRGVVATATVGPEGGELKSESGAILVVPPGALAQPVALTLTKVAPPDTTVLGATPLGDAIEAGPDGTTFLKPVELRLPFDPSKLAPGQTTADIRVRMAPHGSTDFTTLAATVDATAHLVKTSTYHFTSFVPSAEVNPIFIDTTSTQLYATVGVPFTTTFHATGGAAPYAWSIPAPSSLPPGFTLAASGVLSGTPSSAGQLAFFVEVTDANAKKLQAAFALTSSLSLNPKPILSSITPPAVVKGAAPVTIFAKGSAFVPSSNIALDGAPLATAFVSATQLSATIPASSLATTGSHLVTVISPAPGGGTSTSQPFDVTAGDAPVILYITPSVVYAPATSPTIEVYAPSASPFPQMVGVQIDGAVVPSKRLSDSTITVAGPTTLGTHTLHVTSPSLPDSNAVTLAIRAMPPWITSVTPWSLPVSAVDTQVTITGTDFDANSSVAIGNMGIPTLFISGTQLRATVPAASLAAPGTLDFNVYTPPPGGGSERVNARETPSKRIL